MMRYETTISTEAKKLQLVLVEKRKMLTKSNENNLIVPQTDPVRFM